MLSRLSPLLLLLTACTSVPPPPEQAEGTVRVATHNVHYILQNRPTGAWSLADWEARKPALDAAFKAIAADIIGFQEMETFRGGSVNDTNLALEWLLAQNPDYAAAAVGDPRAFPSTQPILYRADRFVVEDEGWFFFSDTPEVIYSRTFNGGFAAFTSWAVFRARETGERLHVFNLHTDFRSGDNRMRSTALVAERIRPLVAAGERVVVLGDFNTHATGASLESLKAVGLTFPPVAGATYHFNRGLHLFGAIDLIAIGPGLEAGPTHVLRGKFKGDWPSDHYPVLADIRAE